MFPSHCMGYVQVSIVIPVHECDKPTKGGCEQICTKKGDEAICKCKTPEFKLSTDGKSCDKGRNFLIVA